MENSLDFFEKIARQLYTYNYKIGETDFFNDVDFIEAKHEQAKYKGKAFYLNLINAMPVFGERMADVTKGEMPTFREKIFRKVLDYCQGKISEENHSDTSQIFFNSQMPLQLSPLDLLENDIDFVLKKMDEQVNQEQFKIFFINSPREIVDVNSFKNFIEANYVKNLGRIKSLIKKAKNIIDIYNEHLYGGSMLANKTYEHVAIQTAKGFFLNSRIPIDCINLRYMETPSYATPPGYAIFFDGNPKKYTNYDFALKCLKFIKAADDGFSKEISMKDLIGQKTDSNIEQQNNKYTKSIESNLSPLQKAFNNEVDYLKAIETITNFFLEKPLNITSALFVKNGNVKKLAFALGEIWRSKKNDVITYEYLLFYKKSFSIFGGQELDENHLFSNNLYKYSISKT